MPHGLFAGWTVETEAGYGNDLHQVLKHAFGDVAAWGKVQPVVFDEWHRVLIQLEQHVVAIFVHHDIANDVAYVVDDVGVQQVAVRNDNFVETQLLQVHGKQANYKLLVESNLDICASFLLL